MHGRLRENRGGALRTTRDSRRVFWGSVDTGVISWIRKSELDDRSMPGRKTLWGKSQRCEKVWCLQETHAFQNY